MFYGHRGRVMGATTTMGSVVGSYIPKFMDGMIMGPISGLLLKKFDDAIEDKIPVGFELLVNNFALCIIGTIITFLICKGV